METGPSYGIVIRPWYSGPGTSRARRLLGARLLHVDDLDEDAAIAAARIAARAGHSGHERHRPRHRKDPRADGALHRRRFCRPMCLQPSQASTTRSARCESCAPVMRAGCASRSARTEPCCSKAIDCIAFRRSPIDAVDTTGAGDVFRAGFIYALLQAQSPSRILRFAAAAAALSCTREGAMTSVPALDEVERLLAAEP